MMEPLSAGHDSRNANGHVHLQPCSVTVSQSSSPAMNKYRYTVNDGNFTDEVREFYEENGYYVVKKLIPQEELDKYAARFQEICNKTVEIPPTLTVMKDVNFLTMDGEYAVNKVQDFQHEPVLSTYFRRPEILAIVENFVGRDIMAVHNMLINKPPDSGSKSSRHPLHQDLHYFPFRPADLIVASWTAMEKVTRENGCLVVVPKSHKGELLMHGYPQWKGGVNKMYHGILDFDPSWNMVHLEMEAGDTVFFHPLLIHGSGSNRTKGFRKAISAHFASSSCRYIDTKGTSHEIIENEILDLAHKKLGDSVEFTLRDLLNFRIVPVQGREGKL